MSASRRGLTLVAAGALALSGCEGDSAAPAVTAAPPPPPPPAQLAASFQTERVELGEGDAAEIGFRYEVSGLLSSFALEIRLAGENGPPEDIELSGLEVLLSPGEVSGEGVFTVTALADDEFAEGDETLAFEFAPSASPSVVTEFGPAVEVVISDTPLDLCEGVVLRATAVERAEWPPAPAIHTLATTFTLDLADAARDSEFELRGPYSEFVPGAREPGSVANFGIRGWRVEAEGPALRHEMSVTWPDEDFVTAIFGPDPEEPVEGEEPPPPPEVDANLVFAVAGPTCPADSVVRCDAEGCRPDRSAPPPAPTD